MIPDILGFKLDEAIMLLSNNGISKADITISEYTSPKGDIIGSDKRVVRVDNKNGKITLLTCNF